MKTIQAERERTKKEREILEKEIKEQAEQLLVNAQDENKLGQTEEQLAAAMSRHAEIVQSKDEEIQSLQCKVEVQY